MIYVFSFAIVMHMIAIFTTQYFGFSQQISFEVVVYSSIDVFLSCLVVFFVLIRFKSFFKYAESSYKRTYYQFFEGHLVLLLVLVLIAAYQAYSSVGLILSGIPRHQLLQEYDRGGFLYMFTSGFFKMLVPIVFYFASSKKVKILAVIGLIFVLAITASRSELKYVINFYIILMLFSSSKNQVARFFAVAVIMIFFAILSTIFLQNRPISDGFFAVMDLAVSVFQYRAYAYYLAEIPLHMTDPVYKVLYPFFGYISEFFIRYTFGSINAIDSEFVGNLHYLGSSPTTGRPYLANVLYPWWSWFVGVFGITGLIIKAIYCYLLLALLASQKMLFTIIILIAFVLLGTGGAHPLLTLTHVLAVFSCIIIDVIVLLSNKYKLKV